MSSGAPSGAAGDGSRLLVLDGIRGIAITLVLFVHFVGDASPVGALEALAVKLANYGIWGVDLFFVLSGYLITGILLRTKGKPRYYRNFYVRRTLRIFPLYYGVLFALFCVLPMIAGVREPEGLVDASRHQAWSWLYATNIYVSMTKAWSLPYVSHFWSLAVEEHFYLAWPFIVATCSDRGLVRVCLGASVLAFALRVGVLAAGGGSVAATALTPCRVDALCAGAALAVMTQLAGREAAGRWARRALPWLAGGVFAVSLAKTVELAPDAVLLALRGTFVAGAFAALVGAASAAAAQSPLVKLLSARPLVLLGKYSYGLYVYHGILAYALFDLGIDRRVAGRVSPHGLALAAQATLGAALSLVVAVVSYELFEKHLLKLKERLAPSSPAALPVTQPGQTPVAVALVGPHAATRRVE